MPSEIITLVQHTPMWHFQPDEKGCCLRATEVKPKLDRFIVGKLGKKNICPSYWVDSCKSGEEDYFALNYKLSFRPLGAKKIIESTRLLENGRLEPLFPLFFGNMGSRDNKQKKQLVYYPAGIEMHILCLRADLMEIILSSLNAFFACTSFGTRQTKGFGFFYPKNRPDAQNTEASFDNREASYQFEVIPFAQYSCTAHVPDADLQNEFVELFRYIHYFHKMIRSGINERQVYYKSLMYHYAQHKEETWDKPVIRHRFQLYNNVYKTICDISSNPDPRYPVRKEMADEYKQLQNQKKFRDSKWLFREALGLSGVQSWRAYNDQITIESRFENGKIDRFKSPLIYRPVPVGEGKYIVYIYLTPIDPQYQKASFKISHQPRTLPSSGEAIPDDLCDMKIYPQFSLEDYFDFVIKLIENGRIRGVGGNYKIRNYVDPIFGKVGKKGNFRKIKSKKP